MSKSFVRFLPVLLVVMGLALFVRVGDLAEHVLVWLKGSGVSFNAALADDKKSTDKPAEKSDSKTDAKPEDKSKDSAKDSSGSNGGAAKETDTKDIAAPEDKTKDIDTSDETRPPSEVTLLQQLNDQRQALAARAADMDTREALLKATQVQIEQKTAELTKLKTDLEGLLKKAESKQDEQMAGLVKIYETMKPKDAANIMNTLDTNTLLGIASRMKESKLAPVLATMNPDRARAVTTELAARAQKIPAMDAVNAQTTAPAKPPLATPAPALSQTAEPVKK